MLLQALENVSPLYNTVGSPQQREHCLIAISLLYSDREERKADQGRRGLLAHRHIRLFFSCGSPATEEKDGPDGCANTIKNSAYLRVILFEKSGRIYLRKSAPSAGNFARRKR